MLLMIQAGHAMAADDQQDKGFWYAPDQRLHPTLLA
jgi:hypothetical protein